MGKDKIFKKKKKLIQNFTFGKQTAAVFDDMLDRSVPFYREIQRMIGEISSDFAQKGTRLYDLGCSTANTFVMIDSMIPKEVTFVGVDDSKEMLVKAKEKMQNAGLS